MSEYDNLTNGQPYWDDLQPRRRRCRIGDTISTTSAVCGEQMRCVITTQDWCDAVNLLIASGKWRVSRCGRCGDCVEECWCDAIPDA